MPYLRSDQALIHVSSPTAKFDKENWDMLEGGDPVAEETVVFPGGMQPQVALGGLPKWSPLTVERTWSETLASVYKELANGTGNILITVTYAPLGVNKQELPSGEKFTYEGVLTSCERPKYKASESTDAYLKITVGINGQVN